VIPAISASSGRIGQPLSLCLAKLHGSLTTASGS
jgi:hypothetical protein